jgi:hypothetical protein
MDTSYDPVRPSHYAFDEGVIECIDYIESHAFDFVEGNVIKYVTRYQHKNGTEDLKKARWYLDRLIERSEKWDQDRHKRFSYNLVVDELEREQSERLDAKSGPANQS